MSGQAAEVSEVSLLPVSLCCLSHSPLFYFLSCQMIVDKSYLFQTNFQQACLWVIKECVRVRAPCAVCRVVSSLGLMMIKKLTYYN